MPQEKAALLVTDAAVRPASASADSFGARFLQSVVENRLRMRRGPAVRQHPFGSVVRIRLEDALTTLLKRLFFKGANFYLTSTKLGSKYAFAHLWGD